MLMMQGIASRRMSPRTGGWVMASYFCSCGSIRVHLLGSFVSIIAKSGVGWKTMWEILCIVYDEALIFGQDRCMICIEV